MNVSDTETIRFDVESADGCYIVAAYGYGFHHRLRNFGDYQSAAIEFARDCRENFNEQNVKSFASTYRAGAKYSYPEIKHGRLNLSRQRHTE